MSRQSQQFPSRLLRCAEAARYLGVGPRRIRQMILAGTLPVIQMGRADNSPFLLDRRDLDAFIDNSKDTR